MLQNVSAALLVIILARVLYEKAAPHVPPVRHTHTAEHIGRLHHAGTHCTEPRSTTQCLRVRTYMQQLKHTRENTDDTEDRCAELDLVSHMLLARSSVRLAV